MSIKVIGTNITSPAGIDYPFLWHSPAGYVYIRREDGKDVDVTTGYVSFGGTLHHEAWARRLSQVSLKSGGDA